MTAKTWCPQCGPDIDVDEDGCCIACGATATGVGAELACVAVMDEMRWREQADRMVFALAQAQVVIGAIETLLDEYGCECREPYCVCTELCSCRDAGTETCLACRIEEVLS